MSPQPLVFCWEIGIRSKKRKKFTLAESRDGRKRGEGWIFCGKTNQGASGALRRQNPKETNHQAGCRHASVEQQLQRADRGDSSIVRKADPVDQTAEQVEVNLSTATLRQLPSD